MHHHNKTAIVQCWLVIMVALLSACDRTNPPSTSPLDQHILAFGTIITLTTWGVDNKTAEHAAQILEMDFQKMHHNWHAWEQGPLQAINQQLQNKAAIILPNDIIPLITKAKLLSQKSQNLFNPAIGKLIALWGFHKNNPKNSTFPPEDEIRRLVTANPTMNDIRIQKNLLFCTNPLAQLDLGGIAKGYAIDLAIKQLRSLNIHNAIINAGGDLRAIGKPGKRHWRVGIRNPKGPGTIASIATQQDESIFTSGGYERYFEYRGKRYHHIIDPSTGYPANGSLSATVIHTDATTADAGATALFIAGPEKGAAIIASMGIEHALLIDDKEKVYLTAQMAYRIRFNANNKPNNIHFFDTNANNNRQK